MITYTIHNPNEWPERNAARFLIEHLIQTEQQFKVITAHRDDWFIHTFNKGTHEVVLPNLHIYLSDNGTVSNPEDNDPVYVSYIEDRFTAHCTDNDFSRLPASKAITDFIERQLNILTAPAVTIEVTLPGRNGFVSPTLEIIPSRKDW